jgi:hypothetical protein
VRGPSNDGVDTDGKDDSNDGNVDGDGKGDSTDPSNDGVDTDGKGDSTDCNTAAVNVDGEGDGDGKDPTLLHDTAAAATTEPNSEAREGNAIPDGGGTAAPADNVGDAVAALGNDVGAAVSAGGAVVSTRGGGELGRAADTVAPPLRRMRFTGMRGGGSGAFGLPTTCTIIPADDVDDKEGEGGSGSAASGSGRGPRAGAAKSGGIVGKTPTMHGFECICCSPDGDVSLMSPAIGKLMGGRSKAAGFADVDAASSSRGFDIGNEMTEISGKGRPLPAQRTRRAQSDTPHVASTANDNDTQGRGSFETTEGSRGSSERGVPWHIVALVVALVAWQLLHRGRST